jgi:hypothetical protein
MTTDNLCFYLQNRLIHTSQTGGQWYSDTSPFSISCFKSIACSDNIDKKKPGAITTITAVIYESKVFIKLTTVVYMIKYFFLPH